MKTCCGPRARLGWLLLLLAGGCGPRPVYNEQVEGTLRFNGAPVPGVRVEFIPQVDAALKAPHSSGVTDDKGHFQLTCDNGKPGAVVGNHVVVVYPGRAESRGADDREPPPGGAPARPAAYVPPAYSTAAKTPLKVEVTTDKHAYDLTLNPAGR
jgi:hypothetical protein